MKLEEIVEEKNKRLVKNRKKANVEPFKKIKGGTKRVPKETRLFANFLYQGDKDEKARFRLVRVYKQDGDKIGGTDMEDKKYKEFYKERIKRLRFIDKTKSKTDKGTKDSKDSKDSNATDKI